MATKSNKSQSNELFGNSSVDDKDNKYSNLILNQNYKFLNVDSVQSKSISKLNKHFDLTEKHQEKRSSKSWNKSMDGLSRKALKGINLHGNEEEKEDKKLWKNDKSSINSSTLSLHIAAYENSDEVLNENSFIKFNKDAKFLGLTKPLQQNSFEIPRQMNRIDSATPQIMQFKASQKLLQPNQNPSQNPQEQKSRAAATKHMNQILPPSSSRQMSSRASGQYAEMADTTIIQSDRPIREIENNSSFSGEGLSLRNTKKINPAVAKALEEIKAWFHGKMDRFKASKLLKKDGDFLVRLGKSMDDLLYKPVLSVKWGQRFYHFLIKEQNSLFWIEKSQFGSIASLIRYNLHTKKPVTQHSGVILSAPILSTKFMARSEKELRRSESRSGVVEATRSLSYAVFGENAPFILKALGKVAILCTVIIILWICTVF